MYDTGYNMDNQKEDDLWMWANNGCSDDDGLDVDR